MTLKRIEAYEEIDEFDRAGLRLCRLTVFGTRVYLTPGELININPGPLWELAIVIDSHRCLRVDGTLSEYRFTP